MELKNMMPNNLKKLLWYSLKEKKNWLILSAVILLVTVVVVPLLMERDLDIENIMVGIMEIFVIIFINCIIDFSYLHDTKKYSYYASKPLTDIQRINIIIISNMIFAAILMLSLWIISFTQGLSFNKIFVVPIAWMVMGIFVAALSSVLVGNSIIGGVATIFNFALPVFILGVIYFALDIVGDMALGFNTDILIEKFIEKVYKIDYLYFVKFVDEPNWLVYIPLLLVICVLLYLTILQILKIRRNERIGELVIYTGYKNFVALLLSTLIPFLFSSAINNDNYIAKLLSFVILGSISFYVTIAILGKSFKIEKKAFKLLGVFMLIFVVFIFSTGMIAKKFESYIPNTEDIVGVLISGNDSIYIENREEEYDINEIQLDMDNYDGINIFTSKEAIEAVRNIQKAIIEDQEYHDYAEVNIVYFLKDESKITRWYKLKYDYYVDYTEEIRNTEIGKNIDKSALELEKTKEYNMKALKFIYDDDFTRDWVNTKFVISYFSGGTSELEVDKQNLKRFREVLRKDLEIVMKGEYGSLNAVLWQNIEAYTDQYYRGEKLNVKEEGTDYIGNDNLSFNIRIESGNNYTKYYSIPPNFDNTREFIKKLVDMK